MPKRKRKSQYSATERTYIVNNDKGVRYDAPPLTTKKVFDDHSLRNATEIQLNPDDTMRSDNYAIIIEVDGEGPLDTYYIPPQAAQGITFCAKPIEPGWYICVQEGKKYTIILENHSTPVPREKFGDSSIIGVIHVDGEFIGEHYEVVAKKSSKHCGAIEVTGFHAGVDAERGQKVTRFSFSSAISNEILDEQENSDIGNIKVEFHEPAKNVVEAVIYNKPQRKCGSDTKQAFGKAISTAAGEISYTGYIESNFEIGEPIGALSINYKSNFWFENCNPPIRGHNNNNNNINNNNINNINNTNNNNNNNNSPASNNSTNNTVYNTAANMTHQSRDDSNNKSVVIDLTEDFPAEEQYQVFVTNGLHRSKFALDKKSMKDAEHMMMEVCTRLSVAASYKGIKYSDVDGSGQYDLSKRIPLEAIQYLDVYMNAKKEELIE